VVFAGHGSTIHFVDLDKSVTDVQTLKLRDLPFLQVEFLTDDAIVAVGFDNNPAFFTRGGNGEWSFKGYAEKESDAKAAAGPAQSATSAAFAKFRQAAYQGTKFGEEVATKVAFTTHTNTITCLKLGRQTRGHFTTSGLDGRITVWDASKYL